MACSKCSSNCSCVVVGENGVSVVGTGEVEQPYVVTADFCILADQATRVERLAQPNDWVFVKTEAGVCQQVRIPPDIHVMSTAFDPATGQYTILETDGGIFTVDIVTFVQGATGVTVTGVGTGNDPFIVSVDFCSLSQQLAEVDRNASLTDWIMVENSAGVCEKIRVPPPPVIPPVVFNVSATGALSASAAVGGADGHTISLNIDGPDFVQCGSGAGYSAGSVIAIPSASGTQASFAATYPGCSDGPPVYCFNDGNMRTAPRPCGLTTEVGRISGAGQGIPGGAGFFANNQANIPGSITNISCYPMSVLIFVFNEATFRYTGTQTDLLQLGTELYLDGNPVGTNKSGAGTWEGNNADSGDANVGSYAWPVSLAPNQTMTVALGFAYTNSKGAPGAFDLMGNFSSVARIITVPSC